MLAFITVLLLAQLGETPGEMVKKAGRVGVSIEKRNGVIVVDEVDPESDAAKKGLKIGDQLLRIDLESTEGMGESAASGRLRGLHGTSVHLTVLPRGQMMPKNLVVTRDVHTYSGGETGIVGDRPDPASSTAQKRRTIEARVESLEITAGEPDEEALRDAFARGAADVATCVGAVGELLPNGIPELGATMTFRREGTISVRTEPPSADLASCLGRKSIGWKTPKPGKEPTVVKVRWTLVHP